MRRYRRPPPGGPLSSSPYSSLSGQAGVVSRIQYPGREQNQRPAHNSRDRFYGMRIDLSRYLPLSRTNSLFAMEAVAPLFVAYEALVFLDPWQAAELSRADPFAASFLLALGPHALGIGYLLAAFLSYTSKTLEEERKNAAPRPFFVFVAALEGALPAIVIAVAAYFLLPLWGAFLPPEETTFVGVPLALASGLSEELIFRFFLQGGLALILREVVSMNADRARNIALLLAALGVAAAHHLGPAGAPFVFQEFLFRFLVPGLLFGYLYQLRGLAFVAYFHSAYQLVWIALPGLENLLRG